MNASMLGKCSILFMLTLAVPHRSLAWHDRLVVASDKTTCQDAQFTHIQDAVDAADAGDEIHICNGLYVEQVIVEKSLHIDAETGALLWPSVLKPNTTSLFDGTPLAVALLVAGASEVSINGLAIDGGNNGIGQCAPNLIGVMFRNASGSLKKSAIRNFRLTPSLAGCQSGTAIFVQSGGGENSTVEIEDNSVHDFQKNGITGNEIGTTVFVRGNVVTGLGPTSGAAQNGIQIAFGAKGEIERNFINDNLWSPCLSISTCAALGTNILVYQSDGVKVEGNRTGSANVGIFIRGNNATVDRNETVSASVFDNIRIEGNGAEVQHNRTFNGAEASMYVMGNNNTIRENDLTESAIGILEAAGSDGNDFDQNKFFDIPIRFQDPTPQGLAQTVQPLR